MKLHPQLGSVLTLVWVLVVFRKLIATVLIGTYILMFIGYLLLALLQYICPLTEPLVASAGAGVYSSENITT